MTFGDSQSLPRLDNHVQSRIVGAMTSLYTRSLPYFVYYNARNVALLLRMYRKMFAQVWGNNKAALCNRAGLDIFRGRPTSRFAGPILSTIELVLVELSLTEALLK